MHRQPKQGHYSCQRRSKDGNEKQKVEQKKKRKSKVYERQREERKMKILKEMNCSRNDEQRIWWQKSIYIWHSCTMTDVVWGKMFLVRSATWLWCLVEVIPIWYKIKLTLSLFQADDGVFAVYDVHYNSIYKKSVYTTEYSPPPLTMLCQMWLNVVFYQNSLKSSLSI